MDAVRWASAYVQVVSQVAFCAGWTDLKTNASEVYRRSSDLMVLKKYVTKPLELFVSLAELRLSRGQSLSPFEKGLKSVGRNMSDITLLVEAMKIPSFKGKFFEVAPFAIKWGMDVVKASAFFGGVLFPSFSFEAASPLASRVASAVTSRYVVVALAAMHIYNNWVSLKDFASIANEEVLSIDSITNVNQGNKKTQKILKLGMFFSMGVMAACAIFPNYRLSSVLKVVASGSAIFHAILLDCRTCRKP